MADQITQLYLYELRIYFSDQTFARMDIDVDDFETEYDVEEAHWLVCFIDQDLGVAFYIECFEEYLARHVGWAGDRYYYFDPLREMPNEENDITWAWADVLTLGSDDGAPEVEPDSP
ncbi:hypothetical protein KP509_07G049700 [Ceratopteris richardii]|uniref:Uncharacterized protein n=2 Tax=Ceratopteris richardii TaxID=49495 RepID=A0A8T2UHN5_CERRI|nr:hypothetical protein KP509_07G049700 [Ceratopteris richardii]